MAKDLDFVKEIQQLDDWEQMSDFWHKLLDSNRLPGWEPGKAFEYFILRAFELSDALVRYPFGVNLFEGTGIVEQVDGVAHFDHISILVESKHYSEDRDGKNKKLNVEPIAKLRNQLMRRPSATIGCVFSMSGFTDPAILLAHFTAPQTILLWEQEDITFALETRDFKEAFFKKYRHAVQEGRPHFILRKK